MKHLFIFVVFMCYSFAQALPGSWTVVLGTNGPTTLTFVASGGSYCTGGGCAFFGGAISGPLVWNLGTGTDCSAPTHSNASPTGVVAGSTITYTGAKITLAQTYTDMGGGVLKQNNLWTANDASNTICSVQTPAFNLTPGSPGFTPQINVDADHYPAIIDNSSAASLAIWTGQTFSTKGVQLAPGTYAAGVQAITLSSYYTSGVAVYNDLITYSNPFGFGQSSNTLSIDVYLAVGALAATIDSIAAPAINAYQAALPVSSNLSSHEPICPWFLTNGNWVSSINPRGYFNGTVNALDPTAFLAAANAAIAAQLSAVWTPAKCQAVYLWDVEGHEYSGWDYIGDPSLLPSIAPEMDAIINGLVAQIQSAGMNVGFLLRPEKIIASAGPPATCQSANTTGNTCAGSGLCTGTGVWDSGTTYSSAGGDVVLAPCAGCTYGGTTTPALTITSGSAAFSVAPNNTHIQVGQGIVAVGVPANTTILTYDGTSTGTMSAQATGDGPVTASFVLYSAYMSLPSLFTNVNRVPAANNGTYWYLVDPFNDVAIDTTKIGTVPIDPSATLVCNATNHWISNGQGTQISQTKQRSLAFAQSLLQSKINYVHSRWAKNNPTGLNYHYVDTTTLTNAWSTSLWTALITANPGIKLSPETVEPSAYAPTFPYNAGTGTSATLLAVNPKSFTLVQPGGGAQIEANGDIPMVQGGTEGGAQPALRAAACAINAAMTITDTNTSTTHTYYGTPCGILPYPVVMRVYYADTAGDLPASTTYCEMRGMPQCYQAGIWTGGATVNLLGLPASQIRYYDFDGNFVSNPVGVFNMGMFNGTIGAH